MKFSDFTLPGFNKPDEKKLDELRDRSDQGDAILRMTKTDGWKLLAKLFDEQLEAYKAEMLLGCEDWNDYQEKRGKAFAIRLLLTDIQDFIEQGEDAKEELDKLTKT